MKNFNKFLYRPFGKTIYDFSLIEDGDSLLICLSGGKDSTVMAELFHRWRKKVPLNIHIEAIYIDFFNNNNITTFLLELCHRINIKLTIINDDSVQKKIVSSRKYSNCYVCARERRMRIFSYASKNNINKISFAHTRNDFSDTLIMNMMYSGNISTLSIKKDFFSGDFTVIRPMALITEELVVEYIKVNKINIDKNSCPYIEGNKRETVRGFLKKFESNNNMVSESMTSAIYKWLRKNLQ